MVGASRWSTRVKTASGALSNTIRNSTKPLLGIAGELARIRVVSQKDYQDKFLDNYKIFETRGAFTYYGYVPPDSADPELSITLTELQRMFRLL